jgi:hypothetical protein
LIKKKKKKKKKKKILKKKKKKKKEHNHINFYMTIKILAMNINIGKQFGIQIQEIMVSIAFLFM